MSGLDNMNGSDLSNLLGLCQNKLREDVITESIGAEYPSNCDGMDFANGPRGTVGPI
jgi:hypothetical protein